jgi:MFS transporter, DHA1 family, staphyloferrin A biosynthesis exporter
LLASLGHHIQEIALYWVAYEISGSAMALGILGLCGAAPRLLLGAVGGVLVDRYDRKRLLILIQFATALPLFVFVALYGFGALQFWHLLALETVNGSIRAMNPSASQSILAELVPHKDLMNAVSLYTMGGNFARITGPSIGGLLVLWIGVAGCYWIYAITLMLSGLELGLMRLTDARQPKADENFVREFKEGFQYVWNSRLILISVVAAYTFSVCVVTYPRFMPVFAKEVLNVGPDGLGLLIAAPGAGGIAALIFLAAVGERWNRAMLLWLMTTVTPLFLILFCASPIFWLSVLMLALVGAGQVSFRTTSRVVIQMDVPRELLGRVMSVFNLDQGMRSVGSVVMGAFASMFGASLGIGLSAAISLIVTTTLFYRLRGAKSSGEA